MAPPTVAVNQTAAYLAGVAFDDGYNGGGGTANDRPVYYHGDQIGTTRRMTGTDASVAGPGTNGGGGPDPTPPTLGWATYSAFGEPVAQTQLGGPYNGTARFDYGYAGAHGYRAGQVGTLTVNLAGTGWGDENGALTVAADPMEDLGWLHVGERYYDPACGRFVMRDPIGVRGGLNVYEYVRNLSTIHIDPTGLCSPLPNPMDLTPQDYFNLRFAWGGLVASAWVTPVSVLCTYGTIFSAAAGAGYAAGTLIDNYQHQNGDYTLLDEALSDLILLFSGHADLSTRSVLPPRAPSGFLGGLGSCFVEWTVVQSDCGPIPVQMLTKGMYVIVEADSANAKHGRIIAVYSSIQYEFIEITIGNETITTTPDHPFWVDGIGWKRAGSLKSGDGLSSTNGDIHHIESVCKEYSDRGRLVFNITVDKSHRYRVGSSGYLVHNKQ